MKRTENERKFKQALDIFLDEEKISVLLSCKKRPENKVGYKGDKRKASDELLLLEIERLRQMLEIASVDISKLINCNPTDYLHDLGTRDYYKEVKEK